MPYTPRPLRNPCPPRSDMTIPSMFEPSVNPEDLVEATKELQAIEAQMQLAQSIHRPTPPASTPGPTPPGPMDLSNGDDTQDMEGRPTKWPRDGSKGTNQPGKGKGMQGRGATHHQQGARHHGGRPSGQHPSGQLQRPWHRSGQGQGYGPSSHPDLHLMCHTCKNCGHTIPSSKHQTSNPTRNACYS